MMFIRFATMRGIKTVVSSTFESGVGMLMLINLAAALNRGDLAVGLDTLDWFEDDLLASPIAVKSGLIDLDVLPPTIDIDILNRDLLEEVHRV